MMSMFEGTFAFDHSGNIVGSKEALAFAIFDEIMANGDDDDD